MSGLREALDRAHAQLTGTPQFDVALLDWMSEATSILDACEYRLDMLDEKLAALDRELAGRIPLTVVRDGCVVDVDFSRKPLGAS